MKKFLRYLKESDRVFNKTVAIVAGSFKPPHKGHFWLVEQYANKVDEVVVLISDPKSEQSIRRTKFGTIITPEMSKEIFDICVLRHNLQNKVKVEISSQPSPIKAMYEYVEQNLHNVNVIFGSSTKDDDQMRLAGADRFYADNPSIHLLDPIENAVEPFENNGIPISASDVRAHIDDPEYVKHMLPAKLTSADVKQIIKILSGGKTLNEDEETAHAFQVNDDVMQSALIYAYDVGMTTKDDKDRKIPITPKKFPEKAVCVKIPVEGGQYQMFLNTETAQWNSEWCINGEKGIMSDEQMNQFFSTTAYRAIVQKLKKSWPLSDEKYNELYNAIARKIPQDQEDANEEI